MDRSPYVQEDATRSTTTTTTDQSAPIPNMDKIYEVDKLVGTKKIQGTTHYKVKWQEGGTTWEPSENLPEAVIREYLVRHTQTGKKRKRPMSVKNSVFQNP